MRFIGSVALGAVAVGVLCLLVGCVTSTETAGANQLTAKVADYPPAPAGAARPRIGCPPWWSKAEDASERAMIGEEAADIASTLMFKTKRVRVIERAQLPQLLKEQALEGIVKPQEMAQSGQVRGVDLLMYGRVTNFRVKTEAGTSGFGLGRLGAVPGVPGAGWFGLFDMKKSREKIEVDVGVDIRLVNPTSGEVACAEQCEYKRADTISAFGLDILGANATSEAQMKVDKDNRGLLLRLAIDEAIRKMLPDLDNFIKTEFKPAD
jgi:curli biogenesis system outer membrane secretion channel CsgG